MAWIMPACGKAIPAGNKASAEYNDDDDGGVATLEDDNDPNGEPADVASAICCARTSPGMRTKKATQERRRQRISLT